jgi:hypothetical protein
LECGLDLAVVELNKLVYYPVLTSLAHSGDLANVINQLLDVTGHIHRGRLKEENVCFSFKPCIILDDEGISCDITVHGICSNLYFV